MLRHLKARFTLIPLLLSASVLAAHAQTAQGPEIYGGPHGLTGRDCEGIMERLDFIAIAADKAGTDQTIIIISRLGNGESSRDLARVRLCEATNYLHERISAERIIVAEGKQVRGLGQLEFYVAGKLHSIFRIKRNRDLVKGCGV